MGLVELGTNSTKQENEIKDTQNITIQNVTGRNGAFPEVPFDKMLLL
jgi:hypothetical protein